MEEKLEFEVQRRYVDVDMQRYMKEYRDVEKFEKLCRQCSNYGKSWGCPPFEYDADAMLSAYDSIRIFVSIIKPRRNDIPLSRVQELIFPERREMERKLRDMETDCGGRSFAFVGKCLYCDGECERALGRPCRHPELVRPSLEGYGFDLSKTLKDFFSLEFMWSREGVVQEQLILVSGFAYNEKTPQMVS